MNVSRNVFSTFLPTVSLSISSSSSSFPISCNKSIFKVHFHFWGNKICHEIYIFIPCYLDEWWWSMVYFNVLSCFSWSIESTKVYTYQTTCYTLQKKLRNCCFVSFFGQLFAPTDDIWLLTGNATVLSIFQKLGAYE